MTLIFIKVTMFSTLRVVCNICSILIDVMEWTKKMTSSVTDSAGCFRVAVLHYQLGEELESEV